MLKYVRKCGHVDEAVIMVIENITYILPTAEGNDYTMGDVAAILHRLPSAEHLLVPEFLGRASLPFRLLRRSLEMHLVNPVPKQDFEEVFANAANEDQSRLGEYALFLLFLAAHKNQILTTVGLLPSLRYKLNKEKIPRKCKSR